MAESIIRAPAPVPAPPLRANAEFFSLNARYVVDPESKTGDVGDDIACLLESAEEVIQSIIEYGEQKGDRALSQRGFAALYLCRQGAAVASAYVSRTAKVSQDQTAEGGQ